MTLLSQAARSEQRRLLLRMVARVQKEIDAAELLRPHLRTLDACAPYLVLGAGKAAGAMARACAETLPRAHGVVVAQQAGDCGAIRVRAGAHPVPDESSRAAAEEILAQCRAASARDEILFLLSGGASSLMALPAPGLSLAHKQEVTRALLASGAPIGDINIVRKHLSAVKGGRLSAAAKASMRTFALSDVPGDDPATIGSGPTVPDVSTSAEAREILKRWGVDPPGVVSAALADPRLETPKQHHAGAHRAYCLIGGPATALGAARAAVEADGFEAIILGSVSGEARFVAADHARLVRQFVEGGRRVALISGGELSVTLTPEAGAGGRCREYLLALAVALEKGDELFAAAWDSDGIDGVGPDAGALLHADSLERATTLGVNARAFLNAHRSGEFFSKLRDAISIGAQPTNVGDVRVIFVGRP